MSDDLFLTAESHFFHAEVNPDSNYISTPIHVLVVEDRPEDCEYFRKALAESANSEFEVIATQSGETGLEICHALKPDCILLDYDLTDFDGLEFLSRFSESSEKLLEEQLYCPAILMLIEPGSEYTARQIFRSGAVDFLVRGEFSNTVLYNSIRNAVGIVTQQREQLAAQLRLQKRFQEEVVRRTKLEVDLKNTRNQLELAREIQRSLIPKSAPVLAGFDIAGVSFPAEETSGDFFDYVQLVDGTHAVLMGDVMEHGLGPALLASEIRAYFKAFAKTNANLAEMLSYVNELLWHDVNGAYFATAFSLKIHAESRRLEFAAAGHAGYVSHVNGTHTRIDAESFPLGIDGTLPVEPCQESYTMKSGEIFLVFTDGIYESYPLKGRVFGVERTLATVHVNRQRPCDDIVRKVIEESLHYAHFRQLDDMTIVAIACE